MLPRMRKQWLVWVLGGALFFSLWFGMAKAGQAGRLATEVENKYMAAFHRLKWASEGLEERTALMSVAQDAELQLNYLADIRVLAAQAVEQMTTLPMLTLYLPEVGKFLQELESETDHLHAHVSTGNPLTNAERARIAYLHQKANRLDTELGHLGKVVSNNIIQWRSAVAETDPARASKRKGPILEGMRQVDVSLKGVGPTTPTGYVKPTVPNLGQPISAVEAAAMVKEFLDQPLQGEPVAAAPGAPGKLPVYYVSVTKVTGTKLTLGVSVAGGKVLFVLDGRPVTDRVQPREALVAQAKALLTRWGYGPTQLLRWEENAGTLVMDFAPEENGVLLLVDQVQVTLTMDNGELVGLDARAYWENHRDRQLGTATRTAGEASRHAGQVMAVRGAPRLVLTQDWRGQEHLAWETSGERDGSILTLHLDATTGQELRILRQSQEALPPYDRFTTQAVKSE
jgi:spore germination protein